MEIKALVADSSAKARKNIIRSLKEIGVRKVAEAADGDEAIQLLEKGTYDVVFAEWNTQLNSGEELVKAFRKVNPKLPIIVTAPPSMMPDDLQKSCPNASKYLTLPFTTEQLRKTVSEYVPSLPAKLLADESFGHLRLWRGWPFRWWLARVYSLTTTLDP